MLELSVCPPAACPPVAALTVPDAAVPGAQRKCSLRRIASALGLFVAGVYVSLTLYQLLAGSQLVRTDSCTNFDLRVTKGFGTRGYDAVRVSVISYDEEPPTKGFFDYSERFKYKWQQHHLHSSVVSAAPGRSTTLELGAANVSVKLPKQGEGTVGLLIADPCVNSPTGREFVHCAHGWRHQTHERIPEIISTFAGQEGIDYWGILGDNFYDQSGEITADVFGRISLEAKSKLFLSVPGNHDYWVRGIPLTSTVWDQCGNGFMQFYAQDTKAGEQVPAGSSEAPFDFSVDPDDRFMFWGCNVPAIENAFWYNQIGNVGFVSQSGAHSLEESLPLLREACAWLGEQPGLDVAVLLGHWDIQESGVREDMWMPHWYRRARELPGCREFDERGMLKYIMGHTHCNNPHGDVGLGFRVAGFGMDGGCGNFGVPLFDTRDGRVRFWYFDTSTTQLYTEVMSCVRRLGWSSCVHLATRWLDEPIVYAAAPVARSE